MSLLAHAGAADESFALVLVFAGLWTGWIGWSRLRGKGFARLPRGAAIGLLVTAGGLIVASTIVPRTIFPTPPVTATRPVSTATLAIERPSEGDVVTGSELDVVLNLQGGAVVDATTTTLTPDTGHIHLTLDGRLVSMTYGAVQVVGLEDAAPGRHTLLAEFVAADHLPFDPRVEASVRFETRAGPS
jgi:hypothetical protein